jgi:hypothetical protein
LNSIARVWPIALVLTGLITGCGGGGNDVAPAAVAPLTLGGTAAVGEPIVGGTVTVTCAAGAALPTVTSSATGAWQVTLTGQTLPCAAQISGGTIRGVANTATYHSAAVAAGTLNITPITELVVANMAGVANTSSWFGGLRTAGATAFSAINSGNVNTALARVRSALALNALNNIDPLTVTFSPVSGNAMDDVLTALQRAMTSTNSTLDTLRTAAAGATFTPPVGFAAAVATGFAGTTSGAGTGPVLPTAPTNASATAVSATQIDLAWDVVSGATGYNVYRSSASNVAIVPGNKVNSVVATNNRYNDSTGLSASTAYFYKITSVSSSAESSGSNEVTATTLAATGSGFVANCTTNSFSHGVTAEQLAPFVRSYAANVYAQPANPGDPLGSPISTATISLSANGTVTYNGTAQPVASLCMDNTKTNLIYVTFSSGLLYALDFFSDGGVTGTLDDAGSSIIKGGSCITTCGGATSGGTGGGASTLPDSVASKVVTMTFCCAASGAPYTNGQKVVFTFSSSGGLFLTEQSTRVSSSFVVTANNEYVWTDSTGLKYALSLSNGQIHEVNLASSSGTFLGQFNTPVSGSSGTGSVGNGTNTGSVTANLGSGPYKLAYSGSDNIGLDSRGLNTMTITQDSAGRMTGYDANTTCTSNCERMLIGTNSVGELAGDAYITMGRWNGGTTAGNFFASPTKTFNVKNGFHYIAAVAQSTFPTNEIITYPKTASTLPTFDDASTTGTMTGQVNIDYFTDKVAVNLTVTMSPGFVVNVVSSGAFISPGNSELTFNRSTGTISGSIPIAQNGTTCTSAAGCSASFRGAVVKAFGGPTRVGMVYAITTTGQLSTVIRGAALF